MSEDDNTKKISKNISDNDKRNESGENGKEYFLQKIFELEQIIKEKEKIIDFLQKKIEKLSIDNENLKIENEKLKNEIFEIEEQISTNKLLYNYNSLIIQPTQRFIVYSTINNDINYDNLNLMNNNNIQNNSRIIDIKNQYINEQDSNSSIYNSYKYNNNLENEKINENFKTKILPFKMQPFQSFDHNKLKTTNFLNQNLEIKNIINNKNLEEDYSNKIFDKNFYSNINNKIIDNITNLAQDIYKFNLNSSFIKHNNIPKKNNENEENNIKEHNNIKKNKNVIKQFQNKEGIKLHSSMFFQNCKNIISKNDYKKLIEIVKLSNLKKIAKEDTYLSIISLLEDKYPELCNEFKLLFV